MSPKATDEGCSRERQRLTPLEHPSSVSALRADPPSPTRGEGARNADPLLFRFFLAIAHRRATSGA
ncbi:MAG: hypothetical protein EOS38_10915 [Mesorhizobium sp.]|nr:MAG: hypothetical protein EOS38_10915 [Mesorhizobium sp.]TIV51929.1 MAG: hypothetical protein E5V88_14635 [Mesorhizobium sp.]